VNKKKVITLAAGLLLLLSGCGGGGGGRTSNATGTVVQVVRGPILHATVKDSSNQSATEQGNGYYKFANSITYPITASGGFIDVDRDGTVNAGDVANDMNLTTKSGTVVTVVTTYEANTTTKSLVEQVANELNISLDNLHTKTPLDSKVIEAMSNTLYKYAKDNTLSANNFNSIKTEIYNEYNRYASNSSHDSKQVETDLIQKLVTDKKLHKLNTAEAQNANQQYNASHNNSSGGAQSSSGTSNPDGTQQSSETSNPDGTQQSSGTSNPDGTQQSSGTSNSGGNVGNGDSQGNAGSQSNGGNEGSGTSEGSEDSNVGGSTGNNTGNSSTGSSTSGGTPSSATSSSYTLLAWNDLGMHCMDGKDFSVFSILPPYNNLNAQLIKKDGTTNKHVVSGVTITYTAAVSLNNKYNTTSMFTNTNNPKTNFWDYVKKLFNTTLANDTGLTGNKVPSSVSEKLTYNMAHNWWEATGIPLTPYNDDGTKNYYPMVNVTAKDASGNVLATTKVVLPISDEMDCKACHSSTSGYALAKPSAGWENDSNAEKDFKFNILRLHDQKFPNAVSDNQTALKAAGYTSYNNAGLYRSAKDGNPTLCATCHASNALPGTGIAGIKPLTEALHTLHANVQDPIENVKLGNSTNRSACYRCHPGATTKCLRGAMGKAVDSNGNQLIQCQSCHGDMNAVGQHGRVGWLEEPNCQACHQNGQRYTKAVTNTMTGTLRSAVDTRFATNANTPANGVSMYRFSTGHGNMQCSACHGSTHAVYPSSHTEDNLQSIAVQGHKGTIAECTACHTTTPNTTSGGPHGMHTVGQEWINNHDDVAERNSSQCKACHGADYKGSFLSKTFSARSFSVEHGTKTYTAGQQVTCYDCHNGPSGD